jgi:hypothetical protein
MSQRAKKNERRSKQSTRDNVGPKPLWHFLLRFLPCVFGPVVLFAIFLKSIVLFVAARNSTKSGIWKKKQKLSNFAERNGIHAKLSQKNQQRKKSDRKKSKNGRKMTEKSKNIAKIYPIRK